MSDCTYTAEQMAEAFRAGQAAERMEWEDKFKAISETHDFLRLHSAALEHQLRMVNLDGQVALLKACQEAKQFASGFPGMSRNNAEALAEELVEVIDSAIIKAGGKPYP